MKITVNKILLLAFAAAIFVSGCSTTTDDNSGDKTDSGIKIGVILPFSGECGAFGSPAMEAIQMAVDEINDAGGIRGKMLELIVVDSRSDPFEASLEAKRLILEDSVVAILGAEASPVSIEIRNMISEYDIIQISGASCAYQLTTDDLIDSIFYRTVLSDYYEARIIADKLAEWGDSAIRILYVDDDYGTGMADRIKNRFEFYGTVDKMVAFESGEMSYAEQIESLFADVSPQDTPRVVLIAYPRCGGQIIRDWRASGYPARWIAADALKAQEFIEYAGAENVEGIYGVSPYNGDLSYEYFRDAYESFTGDDSRRHRCVENWYDATILLAYAILYADTLDPRMIGRTLQIVSSPPGTTVTFGQFDYGKSIVEQTTVVGTLSVRGDINYEGASGSVDMDNNGDIEDASYELWQITNGNFVHIEELTP